MRKIELQAVPNQSLSVTLNNNVYDIGIYACNSGLTQVMLADITINNTPVITGARVLADCLIIPYLYKFDGNFMITSDNHELPDWEKFGITQSLVYLSQDEINALLA